MSNEILKLAKENRLTSLGILFVIACSIIWIVINSSNYMPIVVPYTLADEYGYMANAAYLAGYDWSANSTEVSYYSFGYSLFLVPLFWIFGSGAQIFNAITFLNQIFALAAVVVNCMLIAKLSACYKNKKIVFYLAPFIVLFNFGNVIYIPHALPEVLVNLLVSVLVFLLFKVVEKQTYSILIAFSAISVFLYWVHQRWLVVLIATSLIFFVLLLMKKLSVKKLMISLAVLIAGFFLNELIKSYLINNLLVDSQIIATNNYDGIFTNIFSSDFFEFAQNFITIIIGQLYLLGLSTFFMGYFYFYSTIKKFVVAFKFRKFTEENVLDLFILLVYIGSIAIIGLFFSSSTLRLDMIFYERYIASINVILFLAGFVSFVQGGYKLKKYFKISAAFIAVNIVLICILSLIIYNSTITDPNSITSPSLASYFTVVSTQFSFIFMCIYPILKYIGILLIALCAGKFLIGAITAAVVVSCSCINENIYTLNYVIGNSNFYLQTTNVVNEIQYNNVYCIVKEEITRIDRLDNSRIIQKLQTLFFDRHLKVIYPSTAGDIAFEDSDIVIDTEALLSDNYVIEENLVSVLLLEDYYSLFYVSSRDNPSKVVLSDNQLIGYKQITVDDGAFVFKEESKAIYEETANENDALIYGFDIFINDEAIDEDAWPIIGKYRSWQNDTTFMVLQTKDNIGFIFSKDGKLEESIWVERKYIPFDIWNSIEVSFYNGRVVIANNKTILAEKDLPIETLFESDLPIVIGDNFTGKIKNFYYENISTNLFGTLHDDYKAIHQFYQTQPIESMDFAVESELEKAKHFYGIYVTSDNDPVFASANVEFVLAENESTLQLNGYIPSYEEEGVESNVLDIYANGELVESVPVAEAQPFEIIVDISEYIIRGENTVIEIVADYSFIPVELGLGEDDRDIAFVVEYVGAQR